MIHVLTLCIYSIIAVKKFGYATNIKIKIFCFILYEVTSYFICEKLEIVGTVLKYMYVITL